MKILHTSDWHLGLEFFGVDPTADQQHMIGEIVRIAREQQAGAVIVAGDIFDRAVVAPDAIALYNDAMRALCLELRATTTARRGFPRSAICCAARGCISPGA